jgi:hypothetical protein
MLTLVKLVLAVGPSARSIFKINLVVCKDINKMKNAFDQSYFIQICSLIHQVHGKQ